MGERQFGGILGDNLGEGNCESKIASRQWGDNFCRETSICLAGPLGKRKRTKRENPRTIPEQIGKIRKNRESPKKDKKGRTSPDRETTPFETPRLAALEKGAKREFSSLLLSPTRPLDFVVSFFLVKHKEALKQQGSAFLPTEPLKSKLGLSAPKSHNPNRYDFRVDGA